MVTADFELKAAYIEGAQAAHSGIESNRNPFRDAAKRDFWTLGYENTTTTWYPAPSFQPPLASCQSAV